MGYHEAGFEVVGIDIEHQSNYPFYFERRDALELLSDGTSLDGFDAIHASPPCQAFSRANRSDKEHPDLLGKCRHLLDETGLPYVIENVRGSELRHPVVLEGQLFGLRTSRPRYFECNWPLQQPLMPPRSPHAKMGRPIKDGEHMHVVGHFTDVQAASEALGIDWMTRNELSQAIPPAYTRLIGEQLKDHVLSLRSQLASKGS